MLCVDHRLPSSGHSIRSSAEVTQFYKGPRNRLRKFKQPAWDFSERSHIFNPFCPAFLCTMYKKTHWNCSVNSATLLWSIICLNKNRHISWNQFLFAFCCHETHSEATEIKTIILKGYKIKGSSSPLPRKGFRPFTLGRLKVFSQPIVSSMQN